MATPGRLGEGSRSAGSPRGGLAFAQPEGDEAVGGIVWGNADLNAIPGDHADAKAPHATGELGRNHLPALENDPVATTAEDLLDGTRPLNQIVSGQMPSKPLGRPPRRVAPRRAPCIGIMR